MFEPRDDYGRPFFEPVLNDTGIVVSNMTSEWHRFEKTKELANRHSILGDNHERVTRTSQTDIWYEPRPTNTRYVFDFPKNPTKLKELPDGQVIYEINASKENLRKLIDMPLVSLNSRIRAAEQLLRWEYMMPRLCLGFILNKSDTEPAEKYGLAPPGSAHLVPVKTKVTKVSTTRALTQVEKMGVALGRRTAPTKAELTTTTEVVDAIPALTHWYMYARSKRPYSQQLTGAEMLYTLERLAIWYDMRTGKTLLAQMVAKRLLTEGEIDIVLVVCPRPNMYKPWEPEMTLEGFDCRIIDGTYEEDAAAICERDWQNEQTSPKKTPNCYIINFERVASRLHLMSNHWDMQRVMVIGDESSLIKNPSSKRTKAIHSLCDEVRYVTLLNGTPAEQGPADLWAQYRCLDQYGIKWGKTFAEHENKWLITLSNGKVVPGNKQAYEMLIATTSIRYVRGEADQHSGKDKQFRYVSLRGTQQMIEQSENVKEAGMVQLKDGSEQAVSQCVLAIYGMLREICCGYDKYREIEHGPFIRERHEIDPKLLWIRCFIESAPTEPLVIYCEFNEQEERLKEMLDEMKVKWSSTKARGKTTWMYRLKKDIEPDHRRQCFEHIQRLRDERFDKLFADAMVDVKKANPTFTSMQVTADAVLVATEEYSNEYGHHPASMDEMRYNADAVEWMGNHYRWETEEYHGFRPGKKHSPKERARQMDLFNEGETHVFILKTSEGRGIELSRKEAVANMIGTYPTMIYTAPCWSLGMYDQSQDRCVTSDPKTGKNVCTMIYALGIKGSIEEKVYKALRDKKDVQQTLLQDTQRKGFASFVGDLIEGMRDAATSDDGSDYFDAEEMVARIACGVPPYSKLTPTLIVNKLHEKLKDKLGHTTKKQTLEWLAEPADGWASLAVSSTGELTLHTEHDAEFKDEARHAYALLLSRVEK